MVGTAVDMLGTAGTIVMADTMGTAGMVETVVMVKTETVAMVVATAIMETTAMPEEVDIVGDAAVAGTAGMVEADKEDKATTATLSFLIQQQLTTPSTLHWLMLMHLKEASETLQKRYDALLQDATALALTTSMPWVLQGWPLSPVLRSYNSRCSPRRL